MSTIEQILVFWFGRGNEAEIPAPERIALWFAHNKFADQSMKRLFAKDIEAAKMGQYNHWQESARGSLGLILLLDVLPRKAFRGQARAFQQDAAALEICQLGLRQHDEQRLGLIERVFYYMPLQHAEDLDIQRQSVAAYQSLADLCMRETKELYNTFLNLAVYHFDVIHRFSRFPGRNAILGRESSAEELEFLK